ncbi:hypothetical protein [Photorhabdus bodei]|uniref:hypothetical protein n=1 Tax=Photorhabdus bodei TaxID=2029681 RepID=UPI0030ED8D58
MLIFLLTTLFRKSIKTKNENNNPIAIIDDTIIAELNSFPVNAHPEIRTLKLKKISRKKVNKDDAEPTNSGYNAKERENTILY